MSGNYQRQEFIRHQTEAFKDYAKKEGAGNFESWAESKDFVEEDVWIMRVLLKRQARLYFSRHVVNLNKR